MNIRNLVIRTEKQTDYKLVFTLIEEAFKTEILSDHKEQFLVERLRTSTAFIPELSLVAEYNNSIVGHILLSKVKIKNNQQEFESLALAPVSVLPKFQGKGIGSKLIQKAHKKAKELKYESIVLLGHETYYPKFGYKQAHNYNIVFPFKAPKENCMVVELFPNSLKNISGTIIYPKEFIE